MRSPWDVPPGFPQSEQHHLIDSTTWFVIAVIFAATLIRSTIGFGEALIAVPVLALRIPVAVAAPLAVLISVTVAAIIIAQDWRSVHVGSAAGLVVWALLGIPLGLLLLTHANQRVVKTILAIVIAAFSLYSLLCRSRLHLKKDHASWLFAAGFLSGILGGAYGMNGPPLAVYGALRRWSPQHFRATLQGYFLPASLAGLLGYALIGLWTWPVTRYFLLSLPAALVATLIGRSLNRTFSGPAFLRSVHAGLLVIAAVLLVQTLSR
jgi:hypothetical protein